MSVLLPAPFGPASPKTSLSWMLSEKLSTARTVRPNNERYVCPTFRNSISAATAVGLSATSEASCRAATPLARSRSNCPAPPD